MNTQRERFEAWAAGRFELHWHVDAERYASAITQAAWESWQARCPEGYSVVPNNPTIDMTELGSCHVMRGQDYERAQACWRTMLAAAPKPEDL